MRIRKKLALGVVTGVASLGLFGAAALAALAPDLAGSAAAGMLPSETGASTQDRPDKIKGILDGLVQKGVITQQQADAILAALRDATGPAVKVGAVLRDFHAASAAYLGLSEKDLRTRLAGTSLAAIANATPGKSRDGLVGALATEANADIERALASGRITADQAQRLRAGLATSIASFVDRTWPAKATKPPVTRAANIKAFLGDLVQSGRDYLGLSSLDLNTQLRAGKTIGEIADATPGKSRAGLIAALTSVVNTRIDQAAAAQKITAEQAATLKQQVTAQITAFVDRKLVTKTSPRTDRKP